MNLSLLLVAQIGFFVLTVVFAILLFRQLKLGIEKTSWELQKKKTVTNIFIIGFVTWMVFVSLWSLSGKMTDFSLFPFNLMPVFLPPMLVLVFFLFRKESSEILIHIPMQNIVRLQVFRFFVEILLWILFVAAVAPVQMTFEGRNFDVISGVTAPLIAWLIVRKKISNTLIVLWNILCLGLLINIVSVAIVSMPTPLRVFMNEPANTIVGDFPVALLPGFLVPLAYMLNLFSVKQVMLQRKNTQLVNA